MKAGDALILAPRKQAEGELAVHKAKSKLMQTMPLVLVNNPYC